MKKPYHRHRRLLRARRQRPRGRAAEQRDMGRVVGGGRRRRAARPTAEEKIASVDRAIPEESIA